MSNFVDDDSPELFIKNRAFIGDVKALLRQHFGASIKSGQLDEAIASGLGFNTHAALLSKLRAESQLAIYGNEDAFRKRLESFGITPSKDLLRVRLESVRQRASLRSRMMAEAA